jgi:hypothetical protein
MKRTISAVGLVCWALVAARADAQIQEGLEYSITPFLWGVSLSGTTETGGVGGEVDASFSDILDVLEFALPVHFEAKGPVWTLIAEVNYNALASDLKPSVGGAGELEVDMLIAELVSGYQLTNSFELLFGARYVDIDNTLTFRAGPNRPKRRFNAGQDWIDPLIGFRYGGPISRRWLFSLRGDVGGFGLGSDLTWNLRTGFGVEVSEVTTLRFGWHTMDFDYDDNNFLYDMTQSGPEIGATFKF